MKFPKFLVTVSAIFALSGCGLMSDDKESKGSSGGIATNVKVASCQAVDDPALLKEVNDLNAELSEQLSSLFSALENGTLGSFKSADIKEISQEYDALLKKNPGLCEAQFSKGLVSLASLITNDDIIAMFEMVEELNRLGGYDYDDDDDYDDWEIKDYMTYANILNGGIEKSPDNLVKLARQVQSAEANPQVADMQNKIAANVLPPLDTAIAYLQNIMNYEDFALNIAIDGDTMQIDLGEVGPALAALKLIKSVVVVMVAVDLDVSQNGSYAWLDTIANLEMEDFQNLSSGQKSALDHALSLTDKKSIFTTIKKEWRSRYADIPNLLVTALDDVQDALRYGIKESKKDFSYQKHDVYKVGNGVEYDLSPEAAEEIIANSERLRKYLQGKVNIKYQAGKKSIAINIPKFFQITDGFQDFLPYHKVLPYDQWFTENGDGSPNMPFVFTDAAGKQTFGNDIASEIYTLVDEDGITSLKGKIVFPDPTFGGVFPDFTNDNIFTYLAEISEIEPRIVCEEEDRWGYCDAYSLPSNPSDLDVFNFYFNF